MKHESTAQWVDAIWREAARPERQLLVSEWADGYRVLPPMSAEPGPWRTDRVPYLRAIMDALSVGSDYERVVFMKGAQLGASEAGYNFIGYCIDQAPGNILLVEPTTESIRRNSTARIDPLIEFTPALANKVVPIKSRDSGNSKTIKRFDSGALYLAGANSPVGLRSLPVRFLIMDEVDGFPVDAGDEGDPVALAIQRTATFAGRKKIFLASTPTIKGLSRIETAYREGDQRRYYVPCPQCSEFQTIEWRNITWPENEPHKAFLKCVNGCVIEDAQKPAMLAKGEWRTTAQGDGRTASFHLSSLYSPFESWADIATEFLAAKKSPERLKSWVNLKLGETFSIEGSQPPDVARLLARVEDFDGEMLPDGVAMITAGVDVQDDRLEYEIVGWGRDYESWSLDYRVIVGDPAGADIWKTLFEDLQRTFVHPRQIGDQRIIAAAIDSGGHHTNSVYRFVADKHNRNIWAIKGLGGAGKAAWPVKPSRKNRGRIPLYSIGVDALKEQTYARLRVDDAGAGFAHFPSSSDAEYFAQLTAERRVIKYRKGFQRSEWEKRSSDRNEALDCRVYATAALEGVIMRGHRLNAIAEQISLLPLKTETSPPTKSKTPIKMSRFMDF